VHDQPPPTPDEEQDEGPERQLAEDEMRGGPGHGDPGRVGADEDGIAHEGEA